ncbi:MAG: helix-turn-helix domain-containing protein [Alphaproteobacteria bacterium]|nr:helix-turn-helix domain-containing protein [Alphaproteobacteria bacterium]
MTLSADAKGFGGRLPSVGERAAANTLRQLIASTLDGNSVLRLLDEDRKSTEITLTPAMSALLIELLRHVGKGEAVILVPVGQELTTQQAADILNVSRPYFVSILEDGHIPFSKTGRHRRVRAEDLFAYKAKRDEDRAAGLTELAEMDEELI